MLRITTGWRIARGSAGRAGLAGLVAAALMLAGCVTPTPYQAAGADQRGYAEEKLDEGRYRISFSGNASTPRAVVEDYLIYRAAEVAQARGASHFIFATQTTEATTRYRSDFVRYPTFGYWHSWPWGYDRLGFATSLGTAEARPITRYTAYADVVLLSPAEAAREPRAFEAATVLATLGPRVQRPVPR